MAVQSGGVSQAFPLGSRRTPDPNWWDEYGPVVAKAFEAIGRMVGSYYGGGMGGQAGAEGGKNTGDIISRMFRNQPEVMEHYKESGYDDALVVAGQSGRSPATEAMKGDTGRPADKDKLIQQAMSSQRGGGVPLGDGVTARHVDPTKYPRAGGGGRALSVPSDAQIQSTGMQTQDQGGGQDQAIQAILAALMEQEGGGGQGGIMGMIQKIMGGMGQGQGAGMGGGGMGAGGGAAGGGMMDYMSAMSTY